MPLYPARRTAPFALLLLLAGCQALRLDRTREAPGDWLTEGVTPARRNAVEAALQPPLEEAWSYNAGGGFGPSSPLILGDAVVVATRKGEVHAIDLATGRKRGQAGFGDAIEGSPTIGKGTLYVPVGWGGRAVQAYDLVRGGSRWKARSAPVEAGLLLLDDRLVAADLEGYVRAYDVEDGAVAWEHRLGESVGVEAAPVALSDGALVAVADDAGTVTAFDAATGAVRWRRALAAPVRVTPAAGADAVYVSTTRGRLYAVDAATGALRWAYAAADTTVYFASPAPDGGDLVFGASDGVVRALDAATGGVRWTTAVEGAVAAPPLLLDRLVFVGTMSDELHALDRTTGAVSWTHEVEGRIKSPMAFKNGALVVLAEPRTVYLFKQASPGYASE